MANDDTPELGRLVVLHGAILAFLVAGGKKAERDEGFNEILKEADALTMRVAHRTRSAQNYHETARGKAALADAQQIVDELAAGRVHETESERGHSRQSWVEIVNYQWSREQLDAPPAVLQGMTPERRIVRRWYVDRDLRFFQMNPTEKPNADNP